MCLPSASGESTCIGDKRCCRSLCSCIGTIVQLRALACAEILFSLGSNHLRESQKKSAITPVTTRCFSYSCMHIDETFACRAPIDTEPITAVRTAQAVLKSVRAFQSFRYAWKKKASLSLFFGSLFFVASPHRKSLSRGLVNPRQRWTPRTSVENPKDRGTQSTQHSL